MSTRYGLSVFCVFLAWTGRTALNQQIGENAAPFIFFFAAAAIAAWFGGLGPGVFAIVLGAVAVDWFFIPPVHAWSFDLGSVTSLAAFVISSLCIVATIEGLHRSRLRAVELQKEARRQETLLATTLASIGDAVIVTDQTGNVTFLNAEAERLTGWRKSEVNGKSLSEVFQIVNEQTRQPVENPVEKVFHAGKVVGLANHTVLITKDRTEIPIDDSAAPIRDADGPLFGVVLIFRDVAVQRHRERLLSEQARLLDLSADAIFARDTQNRITYWNNGAEETYGYTREEALGKTTHELLQTEFPERLEDIHRKIQEDGRWQGELIHTRKDGSRIVVISRWSTDCDPRGNPLSILQTNTDITERKRAEDALRESVKRADADLQAIARLHQIGTACVRSGTDFQACLQDILDAAISLTCAEKGHIQLVDGTGTLHIVAHRGFGQQYLNNFSAVRAGDESALGAVMHSHDRVIVEDVTQNQLFSGQPLLDLLLKERVRGVQSTPLTGSDGKILGMVSTHFAQPHWPTERELRLMDLLARQAADYIERKRTEEELHESQNRLSDELSRMTRLHALSVQIAQSDDIHLILQQILAASANFTGTEKGNIQLLDLETGRLRIVVHQGLGQRLIERFAEDGWAPTCGAALCKAERVIIEDVANDPSI